MKTKNFFKNFLLGRDQSENSQMKEKMLQGFIKIFGVTNSEPWFSHIVDWSFWSWSIKNKNFQEIKSEPRPLGKDFWLSRGEYKNFPSNLEASYVSTPL